VVPSEDRDAVLGWPGDVLAKLEGYCPMSQYRVMGIATESVDGHHEHITDLLLEGNRWVDRNTATANIQDPYGDRYYTFAKGQQAWVVSVGCPVCGRPRYLRTRGDSTTENNLLSLPRYRRMA
jgi:hypothetical protein